MTKPLIKQYETVDTKTLQDGWMETAREIESSLINSGAVPGKDYSYLDLYKLAQPIVLKLIENGDIKP
ncbi:hypothetical protein ACFQE2_13405 [Methylophaga thalassica]|nr:hypothetical protein [Methylophaga thalassica]